MSGRGADGEEERGRFCHATGPVLRMFDPVHVLSPAVKCKWSDQIGGTGLAQGQDQQSVFCHVSPYCVLRTLPTAWYNEPANLSVTNAPPPRTEVTSQHSRHHGLVDQLLRACTI